MTPAIYINCKEVPFIDEIFSIAKTLETRTRNVLAKFSGMRVLLVETGKGQPMVRGSVVIGRTTAIRNRLEWDRLRIRTQVPEGSTYDWTDKTSVKWITPVLRPMMCEPFPLPADAKRHGRTWAEYTGPLDFTPDFKGFDEEDD